MKIKGWAIVDKHTGEIDEMADVLAIYSDGCRDMAVEGATTDEDVRRVIIELVEPLPATTEGREKHGKA